MQNKSTSPASFATAHRFKKGISLVLKKGAWQLQKKTSNWSRKTKVASLLLFLGLSTGAFFYILVTSFSREAKSGIAVTPIRLPQNRNGASESSNDWDRSQKALKGTPLKDATRERHLSTDTVSDYPFFNPNK